MDIISPLQKTKLTLLLPFKHFELLGVIDVTPGMSAPGTKRTFGMSFSE